MSSDPSAPIAGAQAQISDPGEGVWAALPASVGLRELKRRKLRLSLPLLIAGLGSYLFALVAFTTLPDLVDERVVGVVNVAYVLAVAQFFVTFAIAAIHSRAARATIDPLAAQVRKAVR